MSDDFDTGAEPAFTFSLFIPVLILLLGLLAWSGYQVYTTNQIRTNANRQFQSVIPALNQAQTVRNRYAGLMKDLVQTAAKDAVAAQIVRDAAQAGWIRFENNPNAAPTSSGDTNAATNPEPPK